MALSIKHINAPTHIAIGKVTIQLVNIFFTLVQCTPLIRSDIPTPIMLEDTTCPVLTGIPVKEQVNATVAVAS